MHIVPIYYPTKLSDIPKSHAMCDFERLPILIGHECRLDDKSVDSAEGKKTEKKQPI